MKSCLVLLLLGAACVGCGDESASVDAGPDAGDSGSAATPDAGTTPDTGAGSDDDDAGSGTSGADASASREDAGAADAAPEDAGDAAEVMPPPKCETKAPTRCDDPPTTYADIDGVLEEHCRTCHYGEFGGPWPLNSYEHVAAWQEDIRSAMLDCSMPPKEEGLVMPTEDRQLLLEWVRCGARK